MGRAGVYVSEKKKISLPTMGMEAQFLAHLETVFGIYCFSVDFVHWQKWLCTTHRMKSFYGHDICFFKFVRIHN